MMTYGISFEREENVRTVIAYATIFLAGMVTAINLSGVVETNPDHQSTWWKALAGIIIAVIVAYWHKSDLTLDTD